MDEKRQSVNLIRERQARWMHGDTLLKDISEERIKGTQQVGRPRCKKFRLDDAQR